MGLRCCARLTPYRGGVVRPLMVPRVLSRACSWARSDAPSGSTIASICLARPGHNATLQQLIGGYVVSAPCRRGNYHLGPKHSLFIGLD
jgi:hypothetical protein